MDKSLQLELDKMNDFATESLKLFKKEKWSDDMTSTVGCGFIEHAINTHLKWDRAAGMASIQGAIQQVVIDYEEARRE